MTKEFFKSADELLPLAVGYGACIATDQITVDGKSVGYMYREEPPGDGGPDNGWRFFSGEEDQAYVDDSSNSSFYDTNTIANYDQSIIPYLNSPPGSAFGKEKGGTFVQERYPSEA